MYIGMTASLISLLYSFLLLIVYSKQTKLKNDENKTYNLMIIINTIGLILEFIVYLFAIVPNIEKSFVPTIIERLYFFYIFSWIFLFIRYIYITAFESKDKDLIKINIMKRIGLLIYIIVILLLAFLPIEHILEGNATYSIGPATDVLFVSLLLSLIISILLVIIRRKYMPFKKKLPVFTLFVCLLLMLFIRIIIPEVLFISATFSFVTIITYFTLENPDIKLIKELSYSKELLERENNATLDNLNKLSSNISESLNELYKFGNKKYLKNDLKTYEEDRKNIQNVSINIVENITKMIDLSKIESGKYELSNNKYDVKEMFEEINSLFAIKIGKIKKYKLIQEFENDLPELLIGDSAKIKQLIISIISTIINISKSTNIIISVSSIEVGSLCRLKFNIKTKNLNLLNEYKIEFAKNNYQVDILDFKIFKHLLELFNSKYRFKVCENKELELFFSINQKNINYAEEHILNENIKNLKIFNCFGKRVLIVDDNLTKINSIVKILNDYKIEPYIARNYNSYTTHLNSDLPWDLIIIDDLMPDAQNFSILNNNYYSYKEFNKDVKYISGYIIPQVVLITEGNELKERYNKNKIDYIIKPIKKEKINEILIKYLK